MTGFMRVGVDTGGTFTDCVIADGRAVRIVKVFSGSPAAPEEASKAIIEGVRRLIGDLGNASVEIVHGTTVSTNTLLERRGARVALITTRGFEDLIEIGRQARPRLYDFNVRRDPPLVSRRMRWGLHERTMADGRILKRPSRRELRRLREMVRRSRAESAAVCLLFSFQNPANERLVLDELRQLRIPLSISHQILPEFREYERLSTTTVNAYLMPRVGLYLKQLAREAASDLPRSRKKSTNQVGERAGIRVFVMESSGGITTARHAAREPVRTIFSGPAGGVAAAVKLAERMGVRQAISFDMGGTSTDVCLFEGRARITNETTVGGLPVAVPVIDVHSVGAGGGSLARIDAGGALRVGPESAGATPGPICYSRGGLQPTVTDANLILGRLDPDHFLGGTFRLDYEAAEEAFVRFIREPSTNPPRRNLFGSPLDLACGIISVANANMERALRVISIERGHDPRDFTLIAFGGAGGLHAAELGRALGVARIIIPQNPGTFSALGILLSDAVKDVSQSVLMAVPPAALDVRSNALQRFLSEIGRRFLLIERTARAELRRDHFPPGKTLVEKQLDVRYSGQSYELTVPFSPRFPAEFERLHEKTYGYAHHGKPLEVVNLRLRLTVPSGLNLPPQRPAGRRARVDNTLIKEKNVWFGNRFRRTSFYARERLGAGSQLFGPAVIVEYSSTTVVPPGFACRVDSHLNLVLTYNAD
jgi:N-methylhydantoinase A